MLLIHQVLLEIVKFFRHRRALLLALHEGSEAGWDIDVDAEDVVDLLLELGGMGRLAEDTHFAWLEAVGEGLIAAGSVRIEDVARLFVALAHGLADLIVAIGGTADEAGDALVGCFG